MSRDRARAFYADSVSSLSVVVVVCFHCSRISGEVSDQTFNTLGFSVSKFVKPFSFSSAFNSDLSCS